jgi:RNA polymerase-binding transcription factor DksA
MQNIDNIKNQLTEKMSTLIAELDTVAVYHKINDDWEAIPDSTELVEADMNNEADAIEAWNERRATVSTLETEYRDVKRALEKIAAGTYGKCEISGEPIEEARLEAKITARTCIAHKEEEAQLPQ